MTWHVAGASVAGSKHAKQGRQGEDAFAYRSLASGSLIIAMADGAGSAERAREAAERATRMALDFLEESVERSASQDDEGLKVALESALGAARASLESLAAECEPRSSGSVELEQERADSVSLSEAVGTTLLLAYLAADYAAAIQIGDGATVVRQNGTLATGTYPVHGEYVNETVFLTSLDYEARVQYWFGDSPGPEAMALFSDGLEHLLLRQPLQEPFPGFFDPLFDFAFEGKLDSDALADLLNSPRIDSRTDDDRTLVVAYRS